MSSAAAAIVVFPVIRDVGYYGGNVGVIGDADAWDSGPGSCRAAARGIVAVHIEGVAVRRGEYVVCSIHGQGSRGCMVQSVFRNFGLEHAAGAARCHS